MRFSQKQDLLETLDPTARLELVLGIVKREEQVLTLNADIHRRVERELGDSQREYYLREQLRIIQEELQLREDRLGEHEEYAAMIEASGMPAEALDRTLAELKRLDRTPTFVAGRHGAAELPRHMLSLPWNDLSADRLDVKTAARILDEEHFGLTAVKERVLDHLAVRQLKRDLRGPILCFIGPPGVGKTSIGRAIAEAMGRQFVRVSLGGVRDEAEIRGHRRTYVGSMPGRIIQSLRRGGTRNPVFMLDEIDKIGGDYRGDPQRPPRSPRPGAERPIQRPLLGSSLRPQLRLLHRHGERARQHSPRLAGPHGSDLVLQLHRSRTHRDRPPFPPPKALRQHGLSDDAVQVQESAIAAIVEQYTREAGVRGLEREITSLIRKCARTVAEGETGQRQISRADLRELLGRPRVPSRSMGESAVGAATGLVVSEAGGDTILIEASLMQPGSTRPELRLTGSMGQVMQESAEAALTYIRAHADELSASEFRYDVHVHVPEAHPKGRAQRRADDRDCGRLRLYGTTGKGRFGDVWRDHFARRRNGRRRHSGKSARRAPRRNSGADPARRKRA